MVFIVGSYIQDRLRPDSHLDGKAESGKAEANRNSPQVVVGSTFHLSTSVFSRFWESILFKIIKVSEFTRI